MKDSIYKSFTLADKIYIIDDVITREIELSGESRFTDDIQNAWVDIKHIVNKFYKEESK
tara:strand:- start:1449 stop:1625 length:177 start_codon:yes stop_codon:yes gene_type:complete